MYQIKNLCSNPLLASTATYTNNNKATTSTTPTTMAAA